MLGGKFLAQGSYGCVYGNPPPKCKNKKLTKDYVVKVMPENDGKEELAEGSIMKKIDPKGEFSIYPMDECIIDKINKKDDNCYRDCEIWDVARRAKGCKIKKKSPIYGLVMKNGGSDLYVQTYNDFYKPIYQKHTNGLLKPMYNIIRGVNIINRTHCHIDIKGLNTLYNEENNKLYLIDFGLMSPKSELFVNNDRHDFIGYFVYPNDFCILKHMSSVFNLCETLYTNKFGNNNILIPVPKYEFIGDGKIKILDGPETNMTIINILEKLLRKCFTYDTTTLTLFCDCPKCKNISKFLGKIYKKTTGESINVLLNDILGVFYTLLQSLNYIVGENGNREEAGLIIDNISLVPSFIKNEHKDKVKFYNVAFNNIFGITIDTLKKLKVFTDEGNPSDNSCLLFFKIIMCYFSEGRFDRNKVSSIDNVFHKKFSKNVVHPLTVLKGSKNLLNKYIELSRNSCDSYAMSKTLMNMFALQNEIIMNETFRNTVIYNAFNGEIDGDEFDKQAKIWTDLNTPYYKNTADFMTIVALLSHESVDKRLILDEDVLSVLKHLAESKDTKTTKKMPNYNNQIKYTDAMKLYNALKKKLGIKKRAVSKIPETVPKKPKAVLKKPVVKDVCGYSKKTRRCNKSSKQNKEICELTDKNRCKVKDDIDVKTYFKKTVAKKPVVKKNKKMTCGINPSSGRCKLGMPNDKKCKLENHNGKNSCRKFDTKKRKVVRVKKMELPELPIGSVNRIKVTYNEAKELFNGAQNIKGHTNLAEAFNYHAVEVVDAHNELVPEYQGLGKIGVAINVEDYFIKPDFSSTEFMKKAFMLMSVDDTPLSLYVPGGMLTVNLEGYKRNVIYKNKPDGSFDPFPQIDEEWGVDGFWPEDKYLPKKDLPKRDKLEERYILNVSGVLAEKYHGKGTLEGGLTYAQVKDLYKKSKDYNKTFAEAYNQNVSAVIGEIGELYEEPININDYIIYEDDPIENLIVKMYQLYDLYDSQIVLSSPIGYVELKLDDIFVWCDERGIKINDIKYKPRKKIVKVRTIPINKNITGMIIVFTGKRLKDLEMRLIEEGAEIKNSVTKQTTVLVAENPKILSGKVKRAKELNIPIMNHTQFKKWLKMAMN